MADEAWTSIFNRQGAHYNIFRLDYECGIDALRAVFPKGEADEMNLVLFSTSGVHGSYVTIEDIESGLLKYGDAFDVDEAAGQQWPDDWHGRDLTVLVIQPRIVCLRYGQIRVWLADIPFLKSLRETSRRAVQSIG